MSINELGVIFIVFVANIFEAITGFAGTMLAMPPSMLLIGVEEAKTVLNIVAMIMAFTLATKNRDNINKKELGKILTLMLIGMGVGLYLFSIIPASNLIKGYGILIMLVAINGIFNKKEIALPGWALIIVVLAAGVIHGMFLSGGALLVIYAISVLKDKSVIRATLSPVWFTLNLFILIQDIAAGRFTPHMILLCILCVPPVAMALWIGNKLHQKIDQSVFVKLTYALLILAGISLIFG